MRVLGIETSSPRGSVALVEGDQVVAHAVSDEPGRHSERILPLIDGLFAQLGWPRTSIQRVGVGVGPGNFTGLRMGLALASGLTLGLGVPAVGVGSLRAVAAGLPSDDPRLRVVVRDARRGDFFVGAYSSRGEEVLAPIALPQATLADQLASLVPPGPYVVLGTELSGHPFAANELTAEPDARVVARLAATLSPDAHPPAPHYVRGPDVVRPRLVPSPLALPRS